MRKFLAEIIAGVIPHKMTRNRWRGILRYGPVKALRLKRCMKHETSAPQYYLALCAIAKNEGPYFKEWIEWHRLQGVEKFYIYDNDSTDNTFEVLSPYIEEGIVEYNRWPGKKQQLPAYDDCMERHRLDTRWLGIIDLDEFIVPQKGLSLTDILRNLEDFPSVEINWLVYGSSGKLKKEDAPIMSRFRRHSLPDNILNRHVKSIVDPRRVCNMIGCHEAARLSGKPIDASGKILKKNFRDREPVHTPVRINHYAVKSNEEFLSKRARGRARTNAIRDMDYFSQYDLNDIEDTESYSSLPTGQPLKK